jgi:hypothetical protein
MGDNELPPVMVAGGSNNAASTTHVSSRSGQKSRSEPGV